MQPTQHATVLTFPVFVCRLSSLPDLCACMFSRPGVMLKTYEDIGEQALGIWGRRMVGFFQVITLFGVCTIFLILIGGNMSVQQQQWQASDAARRSVCSSPWMGCWRSRLLSCLADAFACCYSLSVTHSLLSGTRW